MISDGGTITFLCSRCPLDGPVGEISGGAAEELSFPPEVLEDGGFIPGILGVPCGSNLLKILFCGSPPPPAPPRFLFGAGCSIGIRRGAAFSNQYSSSSDDDVDDVEYSALPEAALQLLFFLI